MSNSQQNEQKAHAKEILREQREFRESLVRIREERDLSQSQVGEMLGLSQSAIAQFERYDSNPTLGTIRRYALAVGASIVMSASPRDAEFVSPSRQASKSFTVSRKLRSGSKLENHEKDVWQPSTRKVEYA
ncbi:helix-turn-helix domain-containing protein [Corynebacterium casei]|uniref:helix-turn-helix domain-containing protein n=1 Tax=Corynebacterium casei TaxID=160386 RepID=UPI003FD21036